MEDLGFALKAATSDTRESHAAKICDVQLEQDAILQIVGPEVSERQMARPLNDGEFSWQQFAPIHMPAVAAVLRRLAWLFDVHPRADAQRNERQACRFGVAEG
jgi:UDPglucose 6-dehydrogenase